MSRLLTTALMALLLTITGAIQGQESAFPQENPLKEPATAQLIAETETIEPGHPFWVGIHLQLDDGWHAYWKNPGDGGMAPTIVWDLPKDFHIDKLQWPTPRRFDLGGAIGFGYEKELLLLAKVTPPAELPREVELGAKVKWVVCDDASCLPGGTTLSLRLPINHAKARSNAKHATLFSETRKKIPQPHEALSASRQNNLILLTFEHPHSIESAQFFPEKAECIDHTAEPMLLPSKEHDGRYHVVLKEAEGADAEAPLRGILVLKHTNGLEAYAVNIPVALESSDEIALLLSTNNAPTSQNALPSPESHAFQGGLLLAVGLAFLGGLILNLMPCVFPVISIKMLSFMKLANQSRSLIFLHGATFAVGVVLSFWVLAGALLLLQAYGSSVGWGFQLQQPLFVALLAALFLVFALSLFGTFELGTGVAALAGKAQTAAKPTGLAASFFSGILATAVATPCTGPFLGTTVGFAVTLSTPLALLVFTSLALGMASPYLLIGAFPALLKYMPKPGNWMITFKEIMGFFMLATVIWLLWVFGALTGTNSLILLLGAFFFLALGCWVFGKWGTPMKSKRVRQASYAISATFFLLAALGLQQALAWEETSPTVAESKNPSNVWETFTPEKFAALRQQGTPVFIDFTAKWCLVCQANHMVLSTGKVNDKFASLGIVRMKADWTKHDPAITEELKKFERNSVPLYVFYASGENSAPVVLPQLLTPDAVLQALSD